jgi:amphi-Trp domain-containing protein
MAQNEQFDYESFQDSQSISKYLEALIEGFERGRIAFSSENDSLILEPNNLLQFAVKAKRKGGKNKLSIKISWKDSKNKSITDNKMLISS